ncbi:hypothetical protein CCP3SC1AL1_690005 [Gammaproteobacteria bacterium]
MSSDILLLLIGIYIGQEYKSIPNIAQIVTKTYVIISPLLKKFMDESSDNSQ